MSSVNQIKGIGPVMAKALAAIGITTIRKLASASLKKVIATVGKARAATLIAAAKAHLSASGAAVKTKKVKKASSKAPPKKKKAKKKSQAKKKKNDKKKDKKKDKKSKKKKSKKKSKK